MLPWLNILSLRINSDNPWDYLTPDSLASNIADNIKMNGGFWSSLYVTLRYIGLAGAIITLAIAFAKLASAGPEKRNEIKDTIFKKFLIIFFLFSAAFILGSVLGVFLVLEG